MCASKTRIQLKHPFNVKACSCIISTGQEKIHPVSRNVCDESFILKVPPVDLFYIAVTLMEDSGTHLVSASGMMLPSKEMSLFPL